MVSLERGDKHSNNADDDEDSDDGMVSSRESLLVRPLPPTHLRRFRPIFSGYLSIAELVIWVTYTILLIVFSQWLDGKPCDSSHYNSYKPDDLVAYFCIGHTVLWVVISVMDRVIQWRHRIIRKRGYLMFYRKMRNIRRVPFVVVSTVTAVLLVYMSLLYQFKVGSHHCIIDHIKAVHILEVIIGVELLISSSCLVYYIVRTVQFNMAKMLPDVVLETNVGPSSMTVLPPGIGFREGEDMDELLEKQADMIRYLQQHNANLERRLLYLQQTQHHS
ncbi:transmembrane protein 192-like [Dysidea avara]|uniref:transmembrane protein 192-like n=1 Tax=Dysidea avara TaxID=196820 RepID=UPI003330FEE8